MHINVKDVDEVYYSNLYSRKWRLISDNRVWFNSVRWCDGEPNNNDGNGYKEPFAVATNRGGEVCAGDRRKVWSAAVLCEYQCECCCDNGGIKDHIE